MDEIVLVYVFTKSVFVKTRISCSFHGNDTVIGSRERCTEFDHKSNGVVLEHCVKICSFTSARTNTSGHISQNKRSWVKSQVIK